MHHKRIDQRLKNYIQEKINENYSKDVWKTEHKRLVINKCEEIIKNNKNVNEVSIDNEIFIEIKLYIQSIL